MSGDARTLSSGGVAATHSSAPSPTLSAAARPPPHPASSTRTLAAGPVASPGGAVRSAAPGSSEAGDAAAGVHVRTPSPSSSLHIYASPQAGAARQAQAHTASYGSGFGSAAVTDPATLASSARVPQGVHVHGGGSADGGLPQAGHIGGKKASLRVIVKPRDDDVPWPRRLARRLCCSWGDVAAGWRDYAVRHFTYFHIHFTYFMLMSLLAGALIFAAERGKWGYIDTLFMGATCMCVTGLTTLDASSMTLASQIIMFIFIFLGGIVLMSAVPVLIRRRYFHKRVAKEVEDEEERARILEEETVEYRALGWVSTIALTYYIVVPGTVAIAWGIYMSSVPSKLALMQANGVNPWWWAFFGAWSAFNTAGVTLLTDSLFQFREDYMVLLPAAALILLGNVMYPPAFRVIVWVLHKMRPRDEALAFLLANPRRCFTHMFGRPQTLMLFAASGGFIILELCAFLALDYNMAVVAVYPPHIRALIGFFQAVSTRTAGLQTIDISLTAPAMQVLYAMLMYVAAYPFIFTVRRTAQVAPAAASSLQGSDNAPIAGMEAFNTGSLGSAASLRSLEAFFQQQQQQQQQYGSVGGSMRLAPLRAQRSLASMYSTPRMSGVSAADTPQFEGGSSVSGAAMRRRGVRSDASMHASDASEGGADDTVGKGSAPTPGVRRSDSVITRASSYMEHELGVHLSQMQRGKVGVGSPLQDQMRNVMSRDLLWLFFALFVICICEDAQLAAAAQPRNMSIFGVLFEIASAYGTVGLSLGYPGSAVSLSGQFSVLSKLIIITLMLFGRHRGLPFSIDSAVYLPSLLNRKAPAKAPMSPSITGITTAIAHTLGRAAIAGGSVALRTRGRAAPRSLHEVFGMSASAGGASHPAPPLVAVADPAQFQNTDGIALPADVHLALNPSHTPRLTAHGAAPPSPPASLTLSADAASPDAGAAPHARPATPGTASHKASTPSALHTVGSSSNALARRSSVRFADDADDGAGLTGSPIAVSAGSPSHPPLSAATPPSTTAAGTHVPHASPTEAPAVASAEVQVRVQGSDAGPPAPIAAAAPAAPSGASDLGTPTVTSFEV